MCVGRPMELVQIVQAMLKYDFVPDFITVDGAEGGTGAAPPEFSNSVGMPLQEALYVEKRRGEENLLCSPVCYVLLCAVCVCTLRREEERRSYSVDRVLCG